MGKFDYCPALKVMVISLVRVINAKKTDCKPRADGKLQRDHGVARAAGSLAQCIKTSQLVAGDWSQQNDRFASERSEMVPWGKAPLQAPVS